MLIVGVLGQPVIRSLTVRCCSITKEARLRRLDFVEVCIALGRRRRGRKTEIGSETVQISFVILSSILIQVFNAAKTWDPFHKYPLVLEIAASSVAHLYFFRALLKP